MNVTYDGRLIVHDRETQVESDSDLLLGDKLEVIRGNGPREGGHMGIAIVTGFEKNGSPELDVVFDETRV